MLFHPPTLPLHHPLPSPSYTHAVLLNRHPAHPPPSLALTASTWSLALAWLPLHAAAAAEREKGVAKKNDDEETPQEEMVIPAYLRREYI